MPQTFFQFVKSQYTRLPIVPTPSTVAGKTYIVTGANGGLGLACAKHFVRLTAARVIISARSAAKGAAAVAEIERDTGVRGVVEAWVLDLGDFESVRAFAGRVGKELERVDAVVGNASIALDQWSVSEGIETTVAVNVFGTFLLMLLIFPKLEESAKKFGIVPHLTVVGSAAGFYCKGLLEGIEGGIIEAFNTEGRLPMGNRYHSTKLLQLYLFRELSTLLPYSKTGVVINYLSPGLCNTGLARHASWRTWLAVKGLNLLYGRTAEMGSRTLLHAAVAGPESHGKFVADCQISEWYYPDWALNESGQKIQKRLWKEVSERLEAIEPGCVTRVVSRAR